MSEPNPLAPNVGSIAITARHYQAISGLALIAIFVIQLQRTSLVMPVSVLANLLVVFIGTIGILYRIRLSPMFVLIALAIPHLMEQHHSNQAFAAEFTSFRLLDVTELLLCAAMLTYTIGQYRLQGLWFGVLPADPRQSTGAQARSEASLTAAELTGLILPVPMLALAAEAAVLVLRRPWALIDVPPREMQVLATAWFLMFVMFACAHAFRYWRRLQMDNVSARLLLQDVLWQQTRGEQRNINRWIVWKKLKTEESARP